VVKPNKKPIIGILGGIGSGKSTVAAQFAELGCKVIDADKIAHKLLDESGVKEQIVSKFGSNILNSEGKIDRKKLADTVFSAPSGGNLKMLNSMLHPVLLSKAERLIEKYNKDDTVKAIVLDMPLLMEVGWDKRCDSLIFVECQYSKRLKRAKKIGLFAENELKIRENFQISLDKKVKLADNAIDNNSGFAALVRQVVEIFSSIMDNR
jgi:dephospho-CoA kinase